MKIAQIAPLEESCPPRLYGGTERIVSYLTEELVRQGHEVTLFASGDSRHMPGRREGSGGVWRRAVEACGGPCPYAQMHTPGRTCVAAHAWPQSDRLNSGVW